jgi:hypothetical protein
MRRDNNIEEEGKCTCTRVDKGSESLIDFHMPKVPICHLIKACMCLDLLMHAPPYSCNDAPHVQL